MSDETGTDCVLCCESLNADEMSCEKCGSVCHLYCMSPFNSDICQACVATDNTLTQQSQVQPLDTPIKSPKASQNSVEVENEPPPQFTQSVENEKLLNHLAQRESDLSVKQRELRQLEAKVRKKESELKLKENKMKAYEKTLGKLKLKLKCLNLEIKNLKKQFLIYKRELILSMLVIKKQRRQKTLEMRSPTCIAVNRDMMTLSKAYMIVFLYMYC